MTILSVLICAAGIFPSAARALNTPEEIAIARENVAKYDWARQERDATLHRVQFLVAMSDEELRKLVPPPDVPREFTLSLDGCPQHGREIHDHGVYPWILSRDRPWKLRCPVGGEEYPSNDFGAYLASGLKDRTLLTGDTADDGWGWTNPKNGRKYWFIAYYCHHQRWLREILPGVRDLGLAYLLTDDPRYAHAAAVLLYQIAEYYPEYLYEKQSRYGVEYDPTYRGRILNKIAETRTADQLVSAYDAIRPALARDTALQRLTGKSAAEVARTIEDRLLRQMARDITDGSTRIQGNFGMHQSALIKLAMVLDDRAHPTRREMLDWLLHNRKVSDTLDLGVRDALVNLVFRDGVPFESPTYNAHWLMTLVEMARLLERAGVDLFREPRFQRLCDFPLNMICAGAITPALGDSSNLFPVAIWLPEVYDFLYRHPSLASRRSRYARALLQSGEKLPNDLFRRPLDRAELERVAQKTPIGVEPTLLPDYGVGILQTGEETNRIALSLFFGHLFSHGHYDGLHFDLFAHGQALLPDFGYPEDTVSTDPRRFGFISNTVAHNTVVVDARRQTAAKGRLHAFEVTPRVQLIEASAEQTYPGVVTEYRRSLLLIRAGPSDAYVVDLFRVRGGRQHDWVVHGTDAEFTTDVALSPPQQEGTLAGEAVKYGEYYDDPKLKDAPYGQVNYTRYEGSGFQFLFNVQRGKAEGLSTATWRCLRKGAEGVAVRAHCLSDGEEILVCDGKPQAALRIDAVKFLLRRRTGENVRSRFLTVFEPFRGEPFIRRVSRGPSPLSLVVEHRYGVDEIVFDDEKVRVRQRDGQGQVGSTFTHLPPLTARVKAFDEEQNLLTLDTPAPLTRLVLAGKVIFIGNEGHSSAYRVARVVDAATLQLADADPLVSRGIVETIDGAKRQLRSQIPLYFPQAGMWLRDELGAIVGRLRGFSGGLLTLEEAVPADAFPDANGDGVRKFEVLDFGVGDRVWLPP